MKNDNLTLISDVFFLSSLAHDGLVAGWNFTARREDGAGGEEALTAGGPPVHHLHRNISSEWRSFRPRPHRSSFGSGVMILREKI